jgi:hypothetical protein
VGELLEILPSAELTYWIEFANLEPWGSEIENWRMGQIAATIVNCTPRPKGSRPFQPTDFYVSPEKHDPSAEARRALIEKHRKARKTPRKKVNRNG